MTAHDDRITLILQTASEHVRPDGSLDLVTFADALGVKPTDELAAAALWGFGTAYEILMTKLQSDRVVTENERFEAQARIWDAHDHG